MPITRYNKSRLLIDGDETFRSIFNGIESAERYILVQFFIIKDDDISQELQAKLIEKAKENVRIYFLYIKPVYPVCRFPRLKAAQSG